MDFNAIVAGVAQRVEKALTQSGPLKNDGRDEEVEWNGAVPVSLQEGHQETETDEHHHVHVLKHYVAKTNKQNIPVKADLILPFSCQPTKNTFNWIRH